MMYNDIQVIKRLKNNPEKKFCIATERDGSYITTNDEGTIVWKGRGQSGQPLQMVVEDSQWVEYKECISFDRVLDEDFAQGDVYITVTHNLIDELELEAEFTRVSLDLFLGKLYRYFSSSDIVDILKYGEYHVE